MERITKEVICRKKVGVTEHPTELHRKYNILSKLPDKATRDDREKARENTIRLNRVL